MTPAELDPVCLVFKPFGFGISCRGLTERELEEAADRWACEVGGASQIPARTEVIVRSGPGKEGCTARDLSAAPEASPFEKKFGGWTVSMAPGLASDVVEPVSGAERGSARFTSAVDLCVAHALALRGAAVLHAAAFEIEGVGVLGVGGSGCGKSTIAAAALRAGGQVVSDDVLVAARILGDAVGVAPLRRDMVLREAGQSILPQALQSQLQAVENGRSMRWRLPSVSASDRFAAWTRPQQVLLLSVDRRLKKTRAGGVDQATALAWLIRATAPLFLKSPFDVERHAVVGVFSALVEGMSARRVRLGRDLLEDPRGTVRDLLAAGSRR